MNREAARRTPEEKATHNARIREERSARMRESYWQGKWQEQAERAAQSETPAAEPAPLPRQTDLEEFLT
jgi:hypothetical protein